MNGGRRTEDGEGGRAAEAGRIEAAAVRLLARREHSTAEIRRKLLNKGFAAEVVEAVVEKLTTKRLVSDERFAASRLHHRTLRGQGPVRIRAELRQQGVADESINRELGAADTDWSALAAEVRRRKFGETPPRDARERAKQARFLQYRGFSADQIRAAFEGGATDERLATTDEHLDD